MTTLWRPTAEIDTLKHRARILHDIRVFFAERAVLEVQVPSITSSSVTEVHIDSIPVDLGTEKAFLHTSPEYPMKRLLAAGLGDCYFMGPVYRQGEAGSRHNPEFTMLEWYRLDYSLEQLSEEVVDLLQQTLGADIRVQELSYSEALEKYTGLDSFNTTVTQIQASLVKHEITVPDEMNDDLDLYLDLVVSMRVFPQLVEKTAKRALITVIKDYPQSQAALAQIRTDAKGRNVAARFEVFVDGLEVANGYQEIQDADLLQQRFEQDNRRRERLGKAQMPIDQYLLDAMHNSLPACSGVALGVDRLMMLALNKSEIKEVIAFPQDRC